MTKSEKFVQVRKFYFAALVARANAKAAKNGEVPFILTKAAAKEYYFKAKLEALRWEEDHR